MKTPQVRQMNPALIGSDVLTVLEVLAMIARRAARAKSADLNRHAGSSPWPTQRHLPKPTKDLLLQSHDIPNPLYAGASSRPAANMAPLRRMMPLQIEAISDGVQGLRSVQEASTFAHPDGQFPRPVLMSSYAATNLNDDCVREHPLEANSLSSRSKAADVSSCTLSPASSEAGGPIADSRNTGQANSFADAHNADSSLSYDAEITTQSSRMRASRVPSSRIARLMHYGSLGFGLAWGAAGSALMGSSQGKASRETPAVTGAFISESNVRRLVDKLSQMRGAALKLGQFLSIQEADLLPKEIEDVLRQFQSSANYMPQYQLDSVMQAELGKGWKEHFESFEEKPFAAASIGQVHRARLSKLHGKYHGMDVAVKVQFPGIRESIESDLSYLKWLLAASSLLPRGLFLESTIRQMRIELQDECDYKREARMTRRFGSLFPSKGQPNDLADLPAPLGVFQVPCLVDGLCSDRVLTTEMMKGRPLNVVKDLSQQRRNEIAESLLFLCLSELFTHRLMQTDPNFSNFLYSWRDRHIQLIDFGATREYSRSFMDDWLRLLLAAVRGDADDCKKWSIKVGYLLAEQSGTCLESAAMIDSHVTSMILLGNPFRAGSGTVYDFSHHAVLTDQIKACIPIMLRERKTPPPKETYSLNRKLSGTFLLCSKLKAQVDCAKVLQQVIDGYCFEDGTVIRYDVTGRCKLVYPAESSIVQTSAADKATSRPTLPPQALEIARFSRAFHTWLPRHETSALMNLTAIKKEVGLSPPCQCVSQTEVSRSSDENQGNMGVTCAIAGLNVQLIQGRL